MNRDNKKILDILVNEGYANAISFSSYRNDSRIEVDEDSVEEIQLSLEDEVVLPLEGNEKSNLNTILDFTEKLTTSDDDGIFVFMLRIHFLNSFS